MISSEDARKRGLNFGRAFLLWVVPVVFIEVGVLYWFLH